MDVRVDDDVDEDEVRDEDEDEVRDVVCCAGAD